MRLRHAIAVAAAAWLAGPPLAGAQSIRAGGPRAVTATEAARGFAWTASAWRDVVAGSPVALRQRVQRARTHRLTRRARRELAAFRRTQRGPFDGLIADAAAQWGVDPFLLKGLLYCESRLDPTRVGARIYRTVRGKRVAVGGGARGIAQFTRDGIAAVNEVREKRQRRGERVYAFTSADVMDPERAIPAAAELLSAYMRRFGRDGGITAYNSGPYGGRLVQRLGFWKARRRLVQVRGTALQGHRFLLKVLRQTNRYRRQSGLRPLPLPPRGPARRLPSERPTS